MTFNTFDSYWKEFGKLEDEVVNSPKEMEEIFKSFGQKVWQENEDRIENEIESFKKNFRENIGTKLTNGFENFVDDCIEGIEE